MEQNTSPTLWTDISGSNDYKNLAANDQEAVRNSYFDKVVAPTIPQGTDPNEVKNAFINKSINTDMQSGAISNSDDLTNRLKTYGMTPSDIGQGEVEGENKLKALGSGLVQGAKSVVGGLVEAHATARKLIGEDSPEQEQQTYSDINQGLQQSTPNSPAVQEHPNFEIAGELTANTVPYALAAPEVAPVEGLSNTYNLTRAAYKLMPSMAATAYLTENTANPEEKVNAAENNAIYGVGGAIVGGKAIQGIAQFGGFAANKIAPIFSENARQLKIAQDLSRTNAELGTTNEKVAQNIENNQNQANEVAPNATPSTAQLSGNQAGIVAAQNSNVLSPAQKEAIANQEAAATTEVNNALTAKTKAPQGTEQEVNYGLSYANKQNEQELANINNSIANSGEKTAAANKDIVSNLTTNVASRAAQTDAAYSNNSKLQDLASTFDEDGTLNHTPDEEGNMPDRFSDENLAATRALVDKHPALANYLDNLAGGNTANKEAILDPKTNYKTQLEANNEQVVVPKAEENADNIANTTTNFNVTGSKQPYTAGTTTDNIVSGIRNGSVKAEQIPTIISNNTPAGVSGGEFVKNLITQVPGTANSVGDIITNKILNEASGANGLDPAKARELLTNSNSGYATHLNNLPEEVSTQVKNKVNALSDLYESANSGVEGRKQFADWLANKNNDEVYTKALSNYSKFNDLKNSVSDLSPETQDGINLLLKQKFFEQNNVISNSTNANGDIITNSEIDKKFLNNLNNPVTNDYKIFKTLYPDTEDNNAVKYALDLAQKFTSETGNVKFTPEQASSMLKDIGKATFFHFGGRLGTAYNIDNGFALLYNQKYADVLNRFSTDPEFAKQILRINTEKDLPGLVKILNNYGLTVPTAYGIIQTEKESNNEAANNTSNAAGSMDNMPNGYTEPTGK